MNRQSISALIVCILLLAIPTFGHAHVHLDESSPGKNEVLSTAPSSIKLWFSGKVESEWSKIEVKDAQGNRVDNGKVSSIDNDPKTLIMPLSTLSSGKYEVSWNIVASDGHRIKGNLSFTVE